MRDLTNLEVSIISGGEGFDYWRAGFDIAIGGLGGAIIGAIGASAAVSASIPGPWGTLAAGYAASVYGAIGLGVGLAGGAAFLIVRESLNYYYS